MSHSNNMNGVPVKISEKYKPPKKLSLTQGVSQRLSNSDNTIQLLNAAYEFGLEKNVLTKIAEWQQMRRQESCDRRERARIRQDEGQKQLEQRQKQLLTAVSYPSAEEFSSDEDTPDDQETVTNLNRINAAMRVTPALSATAGGPIPQVPFSPPSYYDKILEPTVMAGHHQHSRNKSIGKTPNYINYSDFENDTSSPFDNVELKTINDLDILAQVLNKTANIRTEVIDDTEVTTQTTDSNHQNHQENPPSYKSEQLTDNFIGGVIHHTHQANPPIQHYNYQQHQHQLPTTTPSNAYYGYPLRDQLSPDTTTMYQMTEYSNAATSKMDSSWSPGSVSHGHNHIHHQHLNHQFHPSQGHGRYVQSANAFQPAAATDALYDHHVASGLQSKRVYSATQQSAPSAANWSKSKSVPDILKELNDELQTSEGRRVRNNSQSNAEPAIDGNANKKQIPDKHLARNSSKTASAKNEISPRHLTQLSDFSQKLAKNISSMGFPEERVARIAAKIGNDEKKVIEHLISLSELLDLGFDEEKISDALLRFDNNKEKALDFLIS